MKTYQDLTAVGKYESDRMEFVLSAIANHKNSDEYRTARDAEEYYANRNVTMARYRKVLYNTIGQAVPDLISPNYKLSHGFFRRFVIQEVQYVLSNGVIFEKDETKGQEPLHHMLHRLPPPNLYRESLSPPTCRTAADSNLSTHQQ